MDPNPWNGHAAATVGGICGAAAAMAAGWWGGWAWAEQAADPNAGMANLALIYIPFLLTATGAVLGTAAGTWAGLQARHHRDAGQTGVLAGALAFLLVIATPVTSLWPLALLPAAPAIARQLARPRPADSHNDGPAEGS